MTHIENLKRGQFIAVTADKEATESESESFFFRQKPDYNGRPLEILSISLPFIAVVDASGQVASVDVRRWSIQKVSRHYAESMSPAVSGKKVSGKLAKVKQKKRKPGPNDCPRCTARMIQRRKAGIQEQWHRVCRECGYVEVIQ